MFDPDHNFEKKVYAGVLGKIIGVYLGRPFEGWPYDKIMKELGPIYYYVNDKLKDNPDGKVEWVDIPSVQQQKLKEQGLK